jgi:ribonuclease H / adenosylcobalamin/alpha-ribazole phosphatase
VRITPALDEIDFGSFTGHSFEALATDPEWRTWNAERDHARCPAGETMAEAVARARAYLQQLGEADLPALCVSHCDIIRGIVTQLLDAPFTAMYAFDCDPASLTALASGSGALRLMTLNERP